MGVLYEMAVALASDNVSEILEAAYSDEPGAQHSFNLGLLCCIPKGTPSGDTVEAKAVVATNYCPPATASFMRRCTVVEVLEVTETSAVYMLH